MIYVGRRVLDGVVTSARRRRVLDGMSRRADDFCVYFLKLCDESLFVSHGSGGWRAVF